MSPKKKKVETTTIEIDVDLKKFLALRKIHYGFKNYSETIRSLVRKGQAK